MLFGIVWTGQPWQQVDWRVPFFLFTILVAVGEDYNILLMTRALRSGAGTGPARMRLALARTGGTITSCGVIMAGTFATLMLTGLNSLVQIGFALRPWGCCWTRSSSGRSWCRRSCCCSGRTRPRPRRRRCRRNRRLTSCRRAG